MIKPSTFNATSLRPFRFIVGQESFDITERSTGWFKDYWSGVANGVLRHQFTGACLIGLQSLRAGIMVAEIEELTPLQNSSQFICRALLRAAVTVLARICHHRSLWSPWLTQHCAKTSQHVKGRQCLGSHEAFRVAFLLPAEWWAAVNKAKSVLQEKPLYQAPSQHRVSSQHSWRLKSGSVSPLQTHMLNETVSQYVTAWKKMTLNVWKVLKRRWKWTTGLPQSGVEPIQGTGFCVVVWPVRLGSD